MRSALTQPPHQALEHSRHTVQLALQQQPTSGALDAPVPRDPTIYRFYEVLQVNAARAGA
jgi:cyanate lyase